MDETLTVADLIHRLKAFPSDSEVWFQPTDDLGESEEAVNVAVIDGKVVIL